MGSCLRYLKEIQVWRGRIALHLSVNALEGLRAFLVNIFAVSFYIQCLAEGDGKAFFAGLLLFGACNLALRGMSRWYRDCYCEKADIQTEREIYRRLFSRAACVPYERYETAEFLNRLEYLVRNAGSTYRKAMDNIGRTVSLLSTLVSVTAFLCTMDPWLLCVTAAPLLMTKILKKQGRLRHEYEKKRAQNERKKAYVRRIFFFYENMDGLRTSDAYSILDGIGRSAREDNRQLTNTYGKKIAALGFAADNLGANFAFLAGNLYAVFRMLTDAAMPVSEYSVLVVSIASLNSRLSRLGREAAAFAQNRLYIEDFLRFFAEEKPEEERNMTAATVKSLRVCVKRFAWPNGNMGLEGIEFSAKAGEKIVIVGENGAGKSTLFKIMLGLYRKYEGEIAVNESAAGNGMGKRVFCLMQDYQIYPGTIAQNLLLRECGPADEERVWSVLRKVRLEKKVRDLEKGIHSSAELFGEGERAAFSTGERQRLALGRMFMGDYDVLLLDEPTAFLDPLTEGEILEEVFAYAREKLLLLVTHRLSFARLADRIIYLEKGKIREQGTHEELMEKGGMYCQMFSVQKNAYFGQEGGESG